ncbi:MAG: cytidylate kinase-like family protein [Clostridia bacterium]|nr:cytidylate kinase-like family protein [Clostridia bacterium]
MSNRIITISREFGSGGRTVGKKVAERLGISCYDAELIEKIAQESGFASDYIQEESEKVSSWWFSPALGTRQAGLSNQDLVWNAQQKVILELAEKGPCVIVGRCADYILKGKADCLNVFIHAGLESRARRIVQEYGQTDQTPEQRLKEKDKRRAAYYRFYTDMKWGDARNYHICLDSGVLGIDRCADIIARLY